MRSIVCNPSQTECNQHVVLNVIATLVAYAIKPKICAQGDDMRLRQRHTNPSAWIKKKALQTKCFLFWRRHPDLNRGIRVLQTRALPLGYGAVIKLP